MKNVIIIRKSGTVLSRSVESMDELYKVSGYKNNKDFILLYTWTNEDNSYELWGKTKGKAGQENKYELPHPHENSLFFGTLCLLNKDGDLSLSEWVEWYNKKMGGDYGMDDDDETRSEDTETYSDSEYTKEGYLKDDFVVELKEELYD